MPTAIADTAPPPRSDRAQRPLAVLCAVEPALASFEAARQAAALAAGGGTLDLVGVPLPGDRDPETHLTAARFIAGRAGVAPGVIELGAADPVAGLLAAAAGYDVLVVVDRRDDGTPGRLADVAVRRAPCPVLVVRRRGRLRGFPQPVPRCARMARP